MGFNNDLGEIFTIFGVKISWGMIVELNENNDLKESADGSLRTDLINQT